MKLDAGAIREIALGYPEVREDHPWGESAFKVREKTFVFLGERPEGVSFSVKLPLSRDFALSFDGTEPTHYGLGKSGWVTVTVGARTKIPPDVVRAWIDESFRAVAPKKVVATLPGERKEQ